MHSSVRVMPARKRIEQPPARSAPPPVSLQAVAPLHRLGWGASSPSSPPIGDSQGIDESAPGVVSHFWADDPSCSSTSSSYRPRLSSSVGTPDRASRPDPCNPSGYYTNGDRAAERLPRGGQLVPYAARSRATASSGSQSLSSAKIERLLDSLRNTRAAEATKQRARGRRAIETEQHAVRMEPDVQAHNQGSIGQSTAADSLSMQPNNRQRSSLMARHPGRSRRRGAPVPSHAATAVMRPFDNA